MAAGVGAGGGAAAAILSVFFFASLLLVWESEKVGVSSFCTYTYSSRIHSYTS